MRIGTFLAAVSAIALAAGLYSYLGPQGSLPPIMNPTGEATGGGPFMKRKTIDYETVIRSAFTNEASFLTLTWKQTVVRDQHLERSIRFTPFPASRARVRVKYEVEYPIGYKLTPDRVRVSEDAEQVLLTLDRPELIARPSVRLLSYNILDGGILIDEEEALLELQQRIQPEAQRRAAEILGRRGIIPRSERALRRFLEPILTQQADGGSPPAIEFRYR